VAGNLAAELSYLSGQLEGEARYYAQGRLVRRANYRAGKLDGTVDDFGMDGALLQRTSYQANALHGPSLRYWPNGQVMERIDFERGLMQSAARQFDQTGKALGAPGPTLVKRVEQLLRGAP
jgi:antitoxin component YwqK of YwqJK toxin-antitoxin module